MTLHSILGHRYVGGKAKGSYEGRFAKAGVFAGHALRDRCCRNHQCFDLSLIQLKQTNAAVDDVN